MTTVQKQPLITPPGRVGMLAALQRLQPKVHHLQPKILVFTFGAALIPGLLLTSFGWRFVHQSLIGMQKSRLDDQVLAFRGYVAATEKGIQAIAASYAIWTDLYEAVQKQDRAWINQEVAQQLVFSTENINAVQVINRQGEVLAEHNPVWKQPVVAQKVAALVKQAAQEKQAQDLIDTGNHLLLVSVAAIHRTDGTGESPGTLVLGQTLHQDWLNAFLNFSQPTTQLEVLSLQGQSLSTSHNVRDRRLPSLDKPEISQPILQAVQQSRSVYQVKPGAAFNAIYAPIRAGSQPIALIEIQIDAGDLNQALIALQRQAGLGLGLALLLSIAIARHLARQIAQPINQLAQRSKTLAAGDLGAPIPGVGAGGELGQLADAYQDMAQSLQALIDNLEQRVAERTQQLELARRTLEDRVRSRTEELWQKNQQLQQTHDQMQLLNQDLAARSQQLQEALDNLQKTQAQLIQSEKMSGLGQIVAGIAHEINNPISFIYGNLAYTDRYTQDLLKLLCLYQQEYPIPSPAVQNCMDTIDLEYLTEDLPQILASMKAGAERIHQIVLSLRIFSRLDEAEMKLVNIHEGIDSTLLILQSRLKVDSSHSSIKIVKEYGDLPLVECYAGKLNQVFINILNNAIDAIAEVNGRATSEKAGRGQITISTEQREPDWVTIRIADNGPGMTETVKERLFDPFFTTKPVGKGKGLGLAVCYEVVVKKHQGYLKCFSQPGQGAEFWIELPVHQNRDVD